ncbi:MAG: 2-dehydropantoate 2-reductase [Nitrospinota bacterium]|nr:2-dehydropantoate 2-reductase [Nitrospinota bacterium]
MKIVVAGSGGVGGYYGAMMARAGHEVFFIARGAHLEAIAKNGLTVKSYQGDFTIHPPCGQDSSSFGMADLILVCVKAYDTLATTGLYAQSVGPQTLIISLQNGIENEPILMRTFGGAKVLGGIAFIGAMTGSPGVILHTAFGSMAIGEMDGGQSARAEALGKAFTQAGIKCKVSPHIVKDMYGKLLWNVGFNAICSILECSAAEALKFGPTRAMVHGAMMEWVAVAGASGVELDPSSVEKNIETTLKGGEIIPSMLQDKRRGRRMEIESFNGMVARMGRDLGIPVPINSLIADIVRFYNHKLGF